ncbi:nuclear transport factor 2 family protein [Microbacterium sp. C7(2022)]|uniref:nuclear transport factor 2 family protein n=1 Tax=Microbacterium sp. C7(2022) TaxID=2992759 RepID=UPI00237BBEF7|nr:nuclear transport factor 2 family protein [Microbacterium sp. C7(2022)]MDE0545061.1 nuclear transport factor 2 family protein [Microbacterium sp. C7(2022)]
MRVVVESLLAEQAALLRRGEVRALAARYSADAQIVHSGGVAAGRDEIEAVFAAQFAEGVVLESLNEVGRGDDCVNYRAVLTVGGARIAVAGTFVLRDGEIWRHTTIVTTDS